MITNRIIHFILCFTLCIGLMACASGKNSNAVLASNPDSLRVASFNIHYLEVSEKGVSKWNERRRAVTKTRAIIQLPNLFFIKRHYLMLWIRGFSFFRKHQTSFTRLHLTEVILPFALGRRCAKKALDKTSQYLTYTQIILAAPIAKNRSSSSKIGLSRASWLGMPYCSSEI